MHHLQINAALKHHESRSTNNPPKKYQLKPFQPEIWLQWSPPKKMAPQPKGVVPCYNFFLNDQSWDRWCPKSLKNQRFSSTMNFVVPPKGQQQIPNTPSNSPTTRLQVATCQPANDCRFNMLCFANVIRPQQKNMLGISLIIKSWDKRQTFRRWPTRLKRI